MTVKCPTHVYIVLPKSKYLGDGSWLVNLDIACNIFPPFLTQSYPCFNLKFFSLFICSLFLRVLNLKMNQKFKRSICKYHISLPSQWETGGALLNLERHCEDPRVAKRAKSWQVSTPSCDSEKKYKLQYPVYTQ